MLKAKLTISDGREITASESVISIGRSSDNTVSLSSDSNISRYHAEIEKRGDEFWLIELGSSNGTTLNGHAVTSERLLKDGDLIVLGGSSEIHFELQKEEAPAKTVETSPTVPASAVTPEVQAAESEAAVATDTEKASKMPLMLGIMGALCGLAVVCVVAVILVSWSSGSSSCEAVAVISNPDDGETISEETDVQATVTNGECVGRVIFMLDGKELASADSEPYKVSLDPSRFDDSDGGLHNLRLVLEDTEGNKIVQPNEISLVFETLATPTPVSEEKPDSKPTPKTVQNNQQLTSTEVPDAAKRLISQFPSKGVYKFDPQFLQEVQKKTAEFAAEGFSIKAQAYKDKINVPFREQNVDLSLGYFLAMSRSKFNPQKQGAEEGLWRMSNEFATANALNGLCGTELIGDAAQDCAAKVSALYLKEIFLNVFDGDVVYTVAAFGMSPGEAANWKNSLPADRKDFWKIIKSTKQREEVVKFFAAGIVAQNPQKFGLKKDQSLSAVFCNLTGRGCQS